MLRVINTNVNLFQFGLIYTSLYEYISEDGTTTILNQPINQEWENIYQKLTGAVGFFSAFDDQDKDFNSQMTTLLNSNLCSMLFADRQCSEINGIGTQGILGINAFILGSLRETKDDYDNSTKTDSSKTDAFINKNFIQTETAYSIYMERSYLALG